MIASHQQPSPAQPVRWRLAYKIILSIAGLLIVVALGVALLTFIQVRRSTLNELESKGLTIADTLNYTFEVLIGQEAISNLQRLTEDSATLENVEKVAVVARNRNVLASSVANEVNSSTISPQMDEYLTQEVWETRSFLTSDDRLIIIKPLRGKTFLGGMSDANIIGAVEVSLNRHNAIAAAQSAALSLLLISLLGYLLIFVVLALVLQTLVVRPVNQLAHSAQRFRGGERSVRSTVKTKDEIGLLSTTFNAMAQEVEGVLNSLEDQVSTRTHDLEQQRTSLAQTLDELKLSTAQRLALAETLRELSTPIIRLYDRVILLPLVGTIDERRASDIQTALLQGISTHQARKVILDLTGVPIVDEQVAQTLSRLPRSAQLLGTEVIIVGISPDVAQSIIHLGVDLSDVVTFSNLQSGVQYALNSLGFTIASRTIQSTVRNLN